jgi:hypothetical protein
MDSKERLAGALVEELKDLRKRLSDVETLQTEANDKLLYAMALAHLIHLELEDERGNPESLKLIQEIEREHAIKTQEMHDAHNARVAAHIAKRTVSNA